MYVASALLWQLTQEAVDSPGRHRKSLESLRPGVTIVDVSRSSDKCDWSLLTHPAS